MEVLTESSTTVECHQAAEFTLYGSKLNDRIVPRLFRSLGTSPNLVRFELWDVILNQEAATSVGRCLTSTRTIYQIVLSGNQLGNDGLVAISKGFAWNCCTGKLAILHNRVGDPGVAALAKALHGCRLTELSLVGNEIGDDGATSCSTLIGSDNHTLAKLDLSFNRIGNVGAAAIGKALLGDPSTWLPRDHTIVQIGLAGNRIGLTGVRALEAGVKATEGLLDLRLWGNRVSRAQYGELERHLHVSRVYRNKAVYALKARDCRLLDACFDLGVSRSSYDNQGEALLCRAVRKGCLSLVQEIAYGPMGYHPIYHEALEIAEQMGYQRIAEFLRRGSFPKRAEYLDPLTVKLHVSSPVKGFRCKISLIEAKLGYTFSDKELLLRAFTHPSFRKEHPDLVASDNQRLEWWGDKVLSAVISEHIYRAYPQLQEGGLTVMHWNAVDNAACASYAYQLQVAEHLLLGQSHQVKLKDIADLFEAIVGAIEEDGGRDEVKRLLFERLTISFSNAQIKGVDGAKEELLAACHYVHGVFPIYEVQAESSPECGEYFSARVVIENVPSRKAYGRKRGEAEERAAQVALEELRGFYSDKLYGLSRS